MPSVSYPRIAKVKHHVVTVKLLLRKKYSMNVNFLKPFARKKKI